MPIDINTEFFQEGEFPHSGKTEADLDQEELRIGTQWEYEHTTSEEIAKKIAMDHLSEDDRYYTHLLEMVNKYKKTTTDKDNS